MPRGGTSKQNQLFSQSQNIGNTANKNASDLYSTLQPMFQSEATNPTASPLYNTLNTLSGESTGGAVAAAKGQAGLAGARTGNRGAYQTTLDDTVRNAMKTNSTNAQKAAMGIQSQGTSGLENLYGSNVNELMNSMKTGTDIANNQASQPGWFQNLLGFMQAGAQGAAAGAKVAAL